MPQDLSASTVKLRMRPEGASTLKVDTAATVITASTTTSGTHVLPTATITVVSTAGFLPSGWLAVGGQLVSYTGVNSTQFTGCANGTGTISSGATASQIGGIRYDWASVDVDTAGDYVAWWQVTTAGKIQDTAEFQVEILEHAPISAALCSLADVRELMELPAADRGRDQQIETSIEEASAQIIREYEREFAPASTALLRIFNYRPNLNGWLPLAPYDLRTATLVRLHPEETAPTTITSGSDFVFWPVVATQGVFTHLVFSAQLTINSTRLMNFGYAQVEITGNWGFATVPPEVRRACALTVHAWMRRDVTGQGLDIDEARGLRPDQPANYSIPPAARRLLSPFRRHGGAY